MEREERRKGQLECGVIKEWVTMAVDVCGVSRLNSIVGSSSILSRRSVESSTRLVMFELFFVVCFVVVILLVFWAMVKCIVFPCVLCKESVEAWLAWQTHQVGGNVCVFFHHYYRRHLYF